MISDICFYGRKLPNYRKKHVLSQSGRDSLPDPSKFGIARSDAYLMLETEFALTPANLQAFARVGNGRVPIKQGNNFAFNGVDRIDFEDADSTLHFFFPEDIAYALADSANRINVTRVFSSQRGKDYVLVGVPFSWIDAAPKGVLVVDPSTNVATSEDVWLEDATNKENNSAGLIIGKVASFNKKRAIIKFNIAGSGIPSSATVLNAQMKMYYYGTGGSGWVDRWLQAHQILVNWAEPQATSVNRLTGTAWNVAHVGLNDIDAKSSYESTLFFYLVGGQQVYGWKSWDLTSLTQKWVSGTATNYGVVLWATNETTDGKDLRFYSSEAVAPNDVNRPYLEVIYSQQAKTVYFLKDHLGSVRATVQDTVGAPVRGYDDYDPWGYILAGRSLASSILPTTTRNKFTEKEWDDEFGLNWNYFGARYYDAQIGRWPVRDPLDEYSSPYIYVGNNPIRFTDLFGLASSDTTRGGRDNPYTISEIIVRAKHDPWGASAQFYTTYYFGGDKTPVEQEQAGKESVGALMSLIPIERGIVLAARGLKALKLVRFTSHLVPNKAREVLKFIKAHHGAPPAGYKGGRVFENRTGKLPLGGKYKEYDIDVKVQGASRSAERIVIDENTGRAWYSPNHYEIFIEIK